MKCKKCNRKAWHRGLCQRHFNRWVKPLYKMIFEAKTRPKPTKATHVKESVGINTTYTKTNYA